MADKANTIQTAYKLTAVLKAIVAAERRRAESKPYDERNIHLGILEPDQPRKNVESAIKSLFSQLELLLDHLTLLQMAASFESEAKRRLDGVAGAARRTIQASRERDGGWAAKLVRSSDAFEGLHDIGEVLGLTARDLDAFRQIRKARNDFSHGAPLEKIPPITAEETRDMLHKTLARIK